MKTKGFLLSLLCLVLAGAILIQARAPLASRRRFGRGVVPSPQKALETYGKLPLRFEANQGQADPQVKFLSRRSDYTLYLTSRDAVLSLHGPRDASKKGALQRYGSEEYPLSPAARAPAPDTTLRMRLMGANPNARVAGQELLPGKTNYFIGNDPKQWRTNVPNYGKVKYEQVYPGIDLVYYGSQRRLEHDFIVAPGADPSVIRLQFEGADTLTLRDGNLVLRAQEAEIVQEAPFIYQEIDGVRSPVAGRYVLQGANEVGFRVAAYDRSRPLVIDPVLLYSTYLGGAGADYGRAIAADSAGNAYVAGEVAAPGLLLTGPRPTAGVTDAFVSKFNASGSALLYTTYVGGSLLDIAYGIAVDASGNAYLTGTTRSTDFPTASPLQPRYAGGTATFSGDAFVTKLNADGSALVYSTYLGGGSPDEARAIAVDAAGSVYVTGTTSSPNFPAAGPFQPVFGGFQDAFVTKLNAAGSALIYSTYLGGSGLEIGYAIAVDVVGNAYVTGLTESANFPTASPIQRARGGGTSDAFVSKLNPAGSGLVYSTYLGGASLDGGTAIAVDAAANAYVTGGTRSSNFPTANPFQRAKAGAAGWDDAFVAKINAAGTALIYSTYLGGSGGEGGNAVAVDAVGNVYVTGYTEGTDFPTLSPIPSAYGGGGGSFLTKLNASGSALIYSTLLGGAISYAIALDAASNVYLTGYAGSNFPTWNPIQATNASSGTQSADAFVAKLRDLPPGSTAVPSVTLSVEPGTIERGQIAALRWTSQNVNDLQMDPPVGLLGAQGTRFVSPTVTTTSTLTGRGPGGTAQATALLVVVEPPPGVCLDLSGSWTFSESGSLTCTLSAGGITETDTNPYRGSGTVTISQDPGSCSFSYNPIFPGGGTSFQPGRRTGEIAGDRLTISGLFAATLPGATGVSFSSNSFEGTGQVQDNRTMTILGSGRLTGTARGEGGVSVNVNCTGTGNAAMTRSSPPRVAPTLPPYSVVNGASFRPATDPEGAVAPGSIISIFGANFAGSTQSALRVPLPTTLGETGVTFNGFDAPLFVVSAGQINAQVPFEVSPGQVSVQVRRGNLMSATQTVTVAAASPGIFTINSAGTGQGSVLISNTAILAAPTGSVPRQETRPARRGEFVSIFVSGLGDVNNRPSSGAPPEGLAVTLETPSVTIGGIAVTPSFSGLTGFVGLYQVNVGVPSNAPTGNAVPVVLTIRGVRSNTVTMAVQ